MYTIFFLSFRRGFCVFWRARPATRLEAGGGIFGESQEKGVQAFYEMAGIRGRQEFRAKSYAEDLANCTHYYEEG